MMALQVSKNPQSQTRKGRTAKTTAAGIRPKTRSFTSAAIMGCSHSVTPEGTENTSQVHTLSGSSAVTCAYVNLSLTATHAGKCYATLFVPTCCNLDSSSGPYGLNIATSRLSLHRRVKVICKVLAVNSFVTPAEPSHGGSASGQGNLRHTRPRI